MRTNNNKLKDNQLIAAVDVAARWTGHQLILCIFIFDAISQQTTKTIHISAASNRQNKYSSTNQRLIFFPGVFVSIERNTHWTHIHIHYLHLVLLIRNRADRLTQAIHVIHSIQNIPGINERPKWIFHVFIRFSRIAQNTISFDGRYTSALCCECRRRILSEPAARYM